MRLARPGRHPKLLALARALALCGLVFAGPAVAQSEAPWQGELDEAVALAIAGDIADSLAILDRLSADYPDEPEVVRSSAQVLARSERTAEAIERFRRLKELAPDSFTDREQLLVLLVSLGEAEAYKEERKDLLAAYEAAGERPLTRSAYFVRELFAVEKTINVDAYEFYPDSHSGVLTPYYLFVLTDREGAVKGNFLVAENSEKTETLRDQGQISKTDGGYYLEFRRPSDTQASDPVLVTLLPGTRPPAYARAREAVIAFVAERLKS